MASNSGDQQLTFDLERDELQVWIGGLAEARDVLGPDELPGKTGLTWERSRALSSELRSVRDSSGDDTVRVVVDGDAARGLCLSFDEAMSDLGEVDFETRVGVDWEFALGVRSRLEAVVTALAENGVTGQIDDSSA